MSRKGKTPGQNQNQPFQKSSEAGAGFILCKKCIKVNMQLLHWI
ncbi:hypothetical protein CLOLEP_01457 [[Clostridium] leptum DSM 753]|uniref:Uncharacterized protein n=1 Tax=[Clostridium] leptum DSM 753 TaxID=428125 RepID=A7VSB6_9FIRM|nr:hypothetical protein CLOLEP_01457 [[Clostridium] leptum DSM 753]